MTIGSLAVNGQAPGKIRLADIRMRDVCILADATTKTFYAVSSTFLPAGEGRGRPGVRAYTSKDLLTWEGPHVIFHPFDGSDASWSRKSPQYHCHVTDGPYLYRSRSGKLFMIWSSFSAGGYTTGVAVSNSGKLKSPWVQQTEPLFSDDGGHGMIFKRFDGQLMLVLHQPNKRPDERARFFEIEDTGETLKITKPFPAPKS
jgi:hypothetical protein